MLSPAAMKHLLASAIFSALILSSASAEITIDAIGVRVVKEDFPHEDFKFTIRPLNSEKGTKIAFAVKSSTGGLIALDEDQSKISSLKDGDGKELLSDQKSGFPFGQPKISADGKILVFEIGSEKIPAAGTKILQAKGLLKVALANETKLEKSDLVETSEGNKLSVAGLNFEITKAGKPKWGNNPFEITLKTSSDLDQIKEITFLDQSGKAIKADKTGSSSMKMFGKKTVERSFSFKKKHDKVVVQLEKWVDRKVIEIPLDAKASLGM